MISGDKRLLEEGSDAFARLQLQRSQVDQLDVFVWPQVHSKWQIYQAARKNHYDVITSQDPFWRGLLALKIGWLTRTKVNVQIHADLERQSLVKHVLAQMVLRHADSVRVVSGRIKEQVLKMRIRVPIHVLPIYVDIERFRAVVHYPQAHKTILWVGRFEHEKDPYTALTVVQRVLEKGSDARLIMLGSGTLESSLKKRAEGLPVEFPGWQDPVLFLEKADVVLATSPAESWGASIVEALAAGVPVVALDVGVAKEAGATVTTKEELATAVTSVLMTGERGKLLLPVYSKEEWATRWKESLL